MRQCHIPSYKRIVLSLDLASSYSACDNFGSVTLSADPCWTKKGASNSERLLEIFAVVFYIQYNDVFIRNIGYTQVSSENEHEHAIFTLTINSLAVAIRGFLPNAVGTRV